MTSPCDPVIMANKKKGVSALLNDINKYETELDRDPDNFEHYGVLIELLLRDGNNVRAKILLEQGREVNKKTTISVDSRYGFACACISVWKGDRWFISLGVYSSCLFHPLCHVGTQRKIQFA